MEEAGGVRALRRVRCVRTSPGDKKSGQRQPAAARPSAVPGYRLPDHCRRALPARAAPHSLAVPKLENVVPMEAELPSSGPGHHFTLYLYHGVCWLS